MKTVLITGSTGFIGHYLVKEFITDHKVVCLIRPGTKNLERLTEFYSNVDVLCYDIRSPIPTDLIPRVDIILHAGANPSAADSINNPVGSVMDNVLGTVNLLELAKEFNIERFVYYSSGEVFGPVPIGKDSGENDAYNSNSPYAASKAAGEELCVAYANSFNIPVSIIHINNTFGPWCQSNRLPVIIINKILNGDELSLHVGANNTIGGRRWFYAGDVASHTRFILDKQETMCEKWNSAGREFIDNLTFARNIAHIMSKPLNYKMIPVDRPGHDLCFSVDPSKLYKLGWTESASIYQRVQETVDWYLKNPSWLTRK